MANDTNTVLHGAQNPVLAHLFLNFMLDQTIALTNIKQNGYMQPLNAITPERLVYAAHFVTPEAEPRRYDTRFFLVVAPMEQEAAIHPGEATQGDWFAPADILQRHAGDLASLMPPTRIMCNEIARHGSAASVLDDLGSRPVERILFPLRAVLEGRVPELLPREGEPAWW